jgi:hypothetical protein
MKKILGLMLFATLIVFCCVSCITTGEKAQYGLEGEDTIVLNLTNDPNVGMIIVTHVNGEATGGFYEANLFGNKLKYINPIYVKLNGKPIVFTIECPVIIGYDNYGKATIRYRTTELRLSKLSDLKPGDVLTLKWMYQTQTFVFMDATGNIVQQTIPTFDYI